MRLVVVLLLWSGLLGCNAQPSPPPTPQPAPAPPAEPPLDPPPNPSPNPQGNLTMTFFGVDQGDAVLIRAPTGQTVLYDGGRYSDRVLELLQARGVAQLDLVIASHADFDHIHGLIEVVRYYKPRLFMDNGLPHTTQPSCCGRCRQPGVDCSSPLLVLSLWATSRCASCRRLGMWN